jgi:hypothetical protein
MIIAFGERNPHHIFIITFNMATCLLSKLCALQGDVSRYILAFRRELCCSRSPGLLCTRGFTAGDLIPGNILSQKYKINLVFFTHLLVSHRNILKSKSMRAMCFEMDKNLALQQAKSGISATPWLKVFTSYSLFLNCYLVFRSILAA